MFSMEDLLAFMLCGFDNGSFETNKEALGNLLAEQHEPGIPSVIALHSFTWVYLLSLNVNDNSYKS